MLLIAQMFEGMEILVILIPLIALGLCLLGLIGAAAFLRWAYHHRFGFTVHQEPNGNKRISISLRNLLIYAAIVPAGLGIGYRVWHARDAELEAERRLQAVGCDVWRWNDDIWPLEPSPVLSIDFTKSTATPADAALAKHFPELQDIAVTAIQVDSSFLSALPKVDALSISAGTLDESKARNLCDYAKCRRLYVHECQVEERAASLLRATFKDRAIIE